MILHPEYWIAADDPARVWCVPSAAWIAASDPAYVSWMQAGNRPGTATDAADLDGALRRRGLTPCRTTSADYVAAIEQHIDDVARQRAYSGAVSLASYVNSTNAAWSAEAGAFVRWRDDVWAYAYEQMAAVQSGARGMPTTSGIIAELPKIVWPA